MHTITGKFRNIIFQNQENGYTVALFKVKESDLNDLINKTVQIVGNFVEVNFVDNMELTGVYEKNEKYKTMQFNVNASKKILPNTSDKILEFLSSSLVAGCGKKTAEKLVDAYGNGTLEKIKDINNLLSITGMSEKKAEQIHKSILNYDKTSDTIIKLETMGFTVEDAGKIIHKYKEDVDKIIQRDIYEFKEIIDFKKLDHIFISNNEADSFVRMYHLTVEVMKYISFSMGHTFCFKTDILKIFTHLYKITLSEELFDKIIENLIDDNYVVLENGKYYLTEYYEAEESIATNLKYISTTNEKKILDFEEKLNNIENQLGIIYDDVQKTAIKEALENNVTIISGGPGTGKTTILNAIVQLYIAENKLSKAETLGSIALLAPTGRASKKMSLSTGLSAFTIHRYLKWQKEKDSFIHDEYNKTSQSFIVVDEASMIDVKLFAALLNALKSNVKLLLVGDAFQLPSVSAGKVLNNLIDSELFNFIPLKKIYRQSDNSFIPYLAQEIKDMELTEEFLSKKDDYNFLKCETFDIKNKIADVVINALGKGITADNMQVLVPMYKGDVGIDNLNLVLRNIYNPSSFVKKEFTYGDVVYRENDKILQLLNDPDNNIFNGDIGYIRKITPSNVLVQFDDNLVELTKNNFKNVKHAYAISIHKSQGSEFEHVLMPISKDYYMMMFNKLLYTGVSRAKKTLILVGEPMVFAQGIRNNRTDDRNSSLTEKLTSIILNN